MVPVGGILLASRFESLGLRYGIDYAAVWDSTMVRFCFPGGKQVLDTVTARKSADQSMMAFLFIVLKDRPSFRQPPKQRAGPLPLLFPNR